MPTNSITKIESFVPAAIIQKETFVNLADAIDWLDNREAQVTFCQNPRKVMVDCYAEPLHHSCVKFIRAEGATIKQAVNDAINKIEAYKQTEE